MLPKQLLVLRGGKERQQSAQSSGSWTGFSHPQEKETVVESDSWRGRFCISRAAPLLVSYVPDGHLYESDAQ